MTRAEFKKEIWNFYRNNKRDLPWRNTHDPYKILVSEIMLQQTQVSRVLIKYKSWLKRFPSLNSLDKANVREVLREWKGLGYNRRALALKRAAEIIVTDYDGKFPTAYEKVLELPGIGPYTAGALMAFAYNKPVPIIETNIRTVFIHFFFKKRKNIDDKEILKLVEQTLDQKNPKDWYYALMDYGVMLKKTIGNLNTKSAHYAKQTPFKGSNREQRSLLLGLISEKPRTGLEIIKIIKKDKESILKNIITLEKEGFIKKSGKKYRV